MGKKQHQSDKLYITSKEWKNEWGGKKDAEIAVSTKLPFYCCCISMLPFTDACCTRDGYIFDIMNIVPFVKKYSVNPINGKTISLKGLIKLNFHKNLERNYHCPVLFRQFSENSHIVAIAKTGNVYSYDAVSELNLKAGNMKDLLDDTPFEKKDIITLQDPTLAEKMNAVNFYHVKKKLVLQDSDRNEVDSMKYIKRATAETRSAIDELKATYKKPEGIEYFIDENKMKETTLEDKVYMQESIYSTGDVPRSFTSTAITPVTKQEAVLVDKDLVKYKHVKDKGYAQFITNMGNLNIELFCHIAPKSCENFIILSKRKYYDNSIFHRLIPDYLIQGGDPTGTGECGESAWGAKFPAEIKLELGHSDRGILSLTNYGSTGCGSQFFITFRKLPELDEKYAVFGRIVGGLNVLTSIETVETDKKDRPVKKIVLKEVKIIVDPFEKADKFLKEQYLKDLENEKKVKKVYKRTKTGGVGIYLPKKSKP